MSARTYFFTDYRKWVDCIAETTYKYDDNNSIKLSCRRRAKCHPGDKFNLEFGRELAKAKAFVVLNKKRLDYLYDLSRKFSKEQKHIGKELKDLVGKWAVRTRPVTTVYGNKDDSYMINPIFVIEATRYGARFNYKNRKSIPWGFSTANEMIFLDNNWIEYKFPKRDKKEFKSKLTKLNEQDLEEIYQAIEELHKKVRTNW